MATKQAIVREPGSEEILLPERIAQALIGNDHVKYDFALLPVRERPLGSLQPVGNQSEPSATGQ